MSDKVLIPLPDGRWLAMSQKAFEEALQAGVEVLPTTQPPESNPTPKWLSVKEMAEATGMSTTYWAEEARCKRCPSHRFGRSLRIPASYLRSLDGQSTSRSGNGAASD